MTTSSLVYHGSLPYHVCKILHEIKKSDAPKETQSKPTREGMDYELEAAVT